MDRKESKLNVIAQKLLKKVQLYASSDTKVGFMGLSMYPNTGYMINWDIFFLYKALREAPIEVRIHDPHIKGSEALSCGIWLGRQTKDENWTHSYDVIILSCPHIFYINNLAKLGNLFKENKPCLFLDLYGVLSRINSIGDSISIEDFTVEYDNEDILGGLLPIIRPQIEN